MQEYIIKWVLSLLFSVTKDQWQQVLQWVATAGEKFVEGKVKSEFVREKIAATWPSLKTHVIDALVGLAVAWQKKLGKA